MAFGGAGGQLPAAPSVTVMLIVITTIAGILLSTLAASAKRSSSPFLRRVVTVYVEVIRNTPFLVQLFFIFFGLPAAGIRLDPIYAAILAMTLNMTAYTTEIIGAGLDAVSVGQRDAAKALGLKPYQVFIKVVMPQALIVVYPGAHQSDHYHDAGISSCVADCGSRINT